AGDPTWQGPTGAVQTCRDRLARFQLYALRADAIAEPVTLSPNVELERSGRGLAGVLDRLRDQHPERFTQLNEELHSWLPEFDRILFDTPETGKRAIQLRTSRGGYAIPAPDLSDGTLTALTLLTVSHLPSPPAILALEEPDHGIHIRLLREVRDALYRLAYPDQFDDPRAPVQVIATTHSPYMLDLFREHPEEVVISERTADGNGRFTRLCDRVDVDDILRDTSLGDAWYSGILGGVPDQP
ncbi:MAG: AAA family ATPase, partial [Phycisphaeraceae bacterium]